MHEVIGSRAAELGPMSWQQMIGQLSCKAKMWRLECSFLEHEFALNKLIRMLHAKWTPSSNFSLLIVYHNLADAGDVVILISSQTAACSLHKHLASHSNQRN
jgi:hypothetical protein